jgi:hypothetical protein
MRNPNTLETAPNPNQPLPEVGPPEELDLGVFPKELLSLEERDFRAQVLANHGYNPDDPESVVAGHRDLSVLSELAHDAKKATEGPTGWEHWMVEMDGPANSGPDDAGADSTAEERLAPVISLSRLRLGRAAIGDVIVQVPVGADEETGPRSSAEGTVQGPVSDEDLDELTSYLEDLPEPEDETTLDLGSEDDETEDEEDQLMELPPPDEERIQEMLNSPGGEEVIRTVISMRKQSKKPHKSAIRELTKYVEKNAIHEIAAHANGDVNLARRIWKGLAAKDEHLTKKSIANIKTMKTEDNVTIMVTEPVREMMFKLAVQVNTTRAIRLVEGMTESRLKELKAAKAIENANSAKSDKNLFGGSELGFDFSPASKLILDIQTEVLRKEPDSDEGSIMDAMAELLADKLASEIEGLDAEQDAESRGGLGEELSMAA